MVLATEAQRKESKAVRRASIVKRKVANAKAEAQRYSDRSQT